MTIARTDEQRLFAETLRKFLQTENDLEHRRRRLDAAGPTRLALWPGLASIGALGAAFDEAGGGFAGDARTIAISLMEIGRGLAVEPFLGSVVVAGRIVATQNEAETARESVARIIAGTWIPVLAHDGGAHPFGAPLMVAEPRGDAYVLNGIVRCVKHADVADEFLVTARLTNDVAIFRVPRGLLTISSYRLMDGSAAADLNLAQLTLPRHLRLAFTQPDRRVLIEALRARTLRPRGRNGRNRD